MKPVLYITKKYRKGISLFLLLYFVTSPFLFAIPSEKCNGACEITRDIHICSTMDMHKDCCSMMEMNTNSCEPEFTSRTCTVEQDVNTTNNFVVTQKFQSEQNLVIISTIDQYFEDYKFLLSENLHTIINENSPPIYISVQSFLN